MAPPGCSWRGRECSGRVGPDGADIQRVSGQGGLHQSSAEGERPTEWDRRQRAHRPALGRTQGDGASHCVTINLAEDRL